MYMYYKIDEATTSTAGTRTASSTSKAGAPLTPYTLHPSPNTQHSASCTSTLDLKPSTITPLSPHPNPPLYPSLRYCLP